MSTETTPQRPPADSGPEERHDSGSLWRNTDFLKLWTGETVSLLGTYVTQLALPLIAITLLDATPGQVGTLSAVQFLPVLLITVFVGRWVDRYRRRPLLIAANLARAAALAVVPACWWADGLTMPVLYGVALTVGTFSALFDVAYLSYLPSLVPRHHLVAANSRLQGSYAVAQVGGPGLGGLLIRLVGGPFALITNVVSYLFSAVMLLLIRTPEPATAPDGEKTGPEAGLWPSLSLGFTFIWRDRVLRVLTAKGSWFNLCEQALLTVFLVHAVRELGLSAGPLGLCIGLGSLGAVIGTVLARRFGRALGVPGTLFASMACGCAAPALILLARGAALADLALITTAFAVFSIGFTVFNVYFVTLRQTRTPQDRLGRVTAAYRTVAFGTFPVGAWAGGWLAGQLGPYAALAAVCGAFAAGWLVFIATSLRVLRPVTVPLE
ncbi:MFS transporter [Streptomyces pathocidini]|uniref:MFS transporter n=1 Tax=Streptomyces pathocidini TaxID=1650571 RepID=UPI0033FAB8EC